MDFKLVIMLFSIQEASVSSRVAVSMPVSDPLPYLEHFMEAISFPKGVVQVPLCGAVYCPCSAFPERNGYKVPLRSSNRR